mmetsp:Transcript_5003/g.20597  ORF Transcript_5003/g.20597 Transcript_5003/m.20597 type:complete len:238 (-) Transcript_5003:922-1635(-)
MAPEPVVHTPATARSSEDLPQPLGPTTSRASPAESVSDRSRHSSLPDSGVNTASFSSASSPPPPLASTTERAMVPARPALISFISRITSSALDIFFDVDEVVPSSPSRSSNSRSKRSVSAAKPDSCSNLPMMMLSAPCTVLNAIPACVTTPNSTSPAKYLGAMMRLGSANVANSYALVKSARLRLHAIFLRSTAATIARKPLAAAASRLAPPYSAIDSACSLARTKPNLRSASLRSA